MSMSETYYNNQCVATHAIMLARDAILDDEFAYFCRLKQLDAVRNGYKFGILRHNMGSIKQSLDLQKEYDEDLRSMDEYMQRLQQRVDRREFDRIQFVCIDSSVASTTKLDATVFKTLARRYSDRTLYVILDNQISYIETEYKKVQGMRDLSKNGYSRYQYVLPKLAKFETFLGMARENKFKNIQYMSIPMSIYHKVAQKVELRYLDGTDNSDMIINNIQVRNEINDDFQVELLLFAKSRYPQTRGMMLAVDGQMRNKCKEVELDTGYAYYTNTGELILGSQYGFTGPKSRKSGKMNLPDKVPV